jgi:cytochrome P450
MAWWQQAMLPYSALLRRLPWWSVDRDFQRARARLDATIYRLIRERRAGGVDSGDLLSMLLLARDEEGTGGMTDAQVRDEALTIFLAGHETTANALSWTWYLLARHPEAEAALHAELDRVLAGRLPTVEDVPALRYTEMVLAESMRLYPPAWGIGRRALAAYPLDRYTLPAGATVIMSAYVMQRDPRYYLEPERFDPERWTPEARAARPRFAYFPFGGGARVCIGEGFAWLEGILLLATLAQRWKLRLVPGHPVTPQPLITLRPRGGIWMTPEAVGRGAWAVRRERAGTRNEERRVKSGERTGAEND